MLFIQVVSGLAWGRADSVSAQLSGDTSSAGSISYSVQRPSEQECLSAIAGRNLEKLKSCYAPEIDKAGAGEHNKIGTPTVRAIESSQFAAQCKHMNGGDPPCPQDKRDIAGHPGKSECVKIDTAKPAMFTEVTHGKMKVLSDGRGAYVEKEIVRMAYRVHFPESASGEIYDRSNSGVQVIVTLDKQTLKPLFVSTAWTCGCYLTMQEVDNNLWSQGNTQQQLPGIAARIPNSLGFFSNPTRAQPPPAGEGFPTFKVSVGKDNHRVNAVTVANRSTSPTVMDLRAGTALDHLPITANGAPLVPAATSSFYHSDGKYKDLVRGACNATEIRKLRQAFGVLSVTDDPHVGWDRRLGSETNPTVGIDFSRSEKNSQNLTSAEIAKKYHEKCIKTVGCPSGVNAVAWPRPW